MRRVLPSLLVVFGFMLITVPPAAADHCGGGVSEEVCVEGQGAGFDLGGREVRDGEAAAKPVGAPRQPNRPAPPTYVDRNLVPTCTGNNAFDGGALCNAAVQTCPDGQIRFWVFEATIVRVTGQPEPGTGYMLIETVCRVANDPEVDPAAALPGLVQSQFKSVVVLSGKAQVSPTPATLVNVPTRFQTDAPASYQIPLTLLNRSVVITANAERYIWEVGEGRARVSTRPMGYLEYAYKGAGAREVYVDIEWSGTYSVDGGSQQPITGTVTTDGVPTTVEVQQARSELVRD